MTKEVVESTQMASLTANRVNPYDSSPSPPRSTGANREGTRTREENFEDNPGATESDGEYNDESSYEEDDSDGGEDEDDDDDTRDLSLEELLYSMNSFHAICKPVSITMILAALAATFINNEQVIEFGEQQFASAYQVWQLDDSDGGANSTGKNLAMSIGNALVMVSFIGTMTFGIVFLYKYRCMKILIGYMIFSSASLLGVLGTYMASIGIEIYEIPIDVISFYLVIYNFAVVGVTAIFYQQGIPSGITQTYLVATSVILAWHLSHFDDWTAWTLLVMLALYDLCAVLTPCGPLKALVNLMSEKDSPEMPGLLYRAELPAGTQKPGGGGFRSQNSSSSTAAATTTTSRQDSRDVEENGHVNEGDDEEDNNQRRKTKKEKVKRERSSRKSSVSSSSQRRGQENEVPEASVASPLMNGPRAVLPLAVAKVYKLPLVSMYGSSPSSPLSSRKAQRKDRKKRSKQKSNGISTSVNASPLLEDTDTVPDNFYERNFSRTELLADVEVQFPDNGGRIEKTGGPRLRDCRFLVYNRDDELRRTLVIDRDGRVFEMPDDDDDDDDDESIYEDVPAAIHLGLGDFIFYSVMVAKAVMYSFTTFAACMLSILSGLAGTLLLLSVYQSALPALPISIFLGVTFFLLTKVLIEPWIEVIMTSPVYV